MSTRHISTGTLAGVACILEATARKPGNVHPEWAFQDTTYLDFLLGATAITTALERTPQRGVGETVLEAVRSMRNVAGKNTHLGVILLLAPLCALPRSILEAVASEPGRGALQSAARELIGALGRSDAELVYEAIRLAAPGGLGVAAKGDVRESPPGTLLEVMSLSGDRDLVARQYSNGYDQVVREGLPRMARTVRAGRSLEDSVILCQVEFLADHGDSLIARKCGDAISREAALRAKEALKSLGPSDSVRGKALEALDIWLRADGNRRNPGTSADLTAAVLFLALAGGIIPMPIGTDSAHHG
ncbi:MAG TPA: triphosphoribosyl-dephospho-CoA synthase [Planctomycetota bacterium]|nr:triphosphoribosyl-dephospho-CoA synthase [Planctomycetota bacterium]